MGEYKDILKLIQYLDIEELEKLVKECNNLIYIRKDFEKYRKIINEKLE